MTTPSQGASLVEEGLRLLDAATPGPWNVLHEGQGRERSATINGIQVAVTNACQCGQIWSVAADYPVAFCDTTELGEGPAPQARMANSRLIAFAVNNLPTLLSALEEQEKAKGEIEHLKNAYSRMNEYVCQTLGKALGYPWFKDDQKNFPGATEENGVCVGEHVAESIADEAWTRIATLRAERDRAVKAVASIDGRKLAQAFADTFEGGGWADAPEWGDFDALGKARWNKAASRLRELLSTLTSKEGE